MMYRSLRDLSLIEEIADADDDFIPIVRYSLVFNIDLFEYEYSYMNPKFGIYPYVQCRKLNMLIEKSLNKKWALKETSNTE